VKGRDLIHSRTGRNAAKEKSCPRGWGTHEPSSPPGRSRKNSSGAFTPKGKKFAKKGAALQKEITGAGVRRKWPNKTPYFAGRSFP